MERERERDNVSRVGTQNSNEKTYSVVVLLEVFGYHGLVASERFL